MQAAWFRKRETKSPCREKKKEESLGVSSEQRETLTLEVENERKGGNK